MSSTADLSSTILAPRLAYAGFVLVAYELVKSMIVGPIKAFYSNTTFGEGLPFKTYDADVRARHPHEFEACLLYLRDFTEALDAEDVDTIQELRQHRNELAHDLVHQLPNIQFDVYEPLWTRVERTLFKLSNYRVRMEIGADPSFRGIDWESVRGTEYLLFEKVVDSVKQLSE